MVAKYSNPTIDDKNPALPRIRNVPSFPTFRVLKVMQDLYHQQYDCQAVQP